MAGGASSWSVRGLVALATLGLGAVGGHTLTRRVLADPVLAAQLLPDEALAVVHPPRPSAGPVPVPAAAPERDPGCCSETPSHERPADLPLPTEGLHGAAARGEVAELRALLDGGADIDARDDRGRTALAVAVLAGRMPALRLLLDRNANPEIPDRHHATPVMLAAGFGDVAMVDAIVGHGVKPIGANDRGHTALMLAAEGGHTAAVGRLLEHGVKVDRRCDRGRTALMYAVDGGHDEVVDVLLSRRADPNVGDQKGVAALALTAQLGDAGIARRLLDARARIDAADQQGMTPLAHAARRALPNPQGRHEVARLLAARGASFELELSRELAAQLDVAFLERLAKQHGKRLVIRDPAAEAEDSAQSREVVQLHRGVGPESSRALPTHLDERMMVFLGRYWRVPNVVARVTVEFLQPRPKQQVFLAGDREGKAPVQVDDSLLIESYRVSGQKFHTHHLGRLDAVRMDDTIIRRRGRYSGSVGPLDLTRYFHGTTKVVLSVLDWGGQAHAGEMFLGVVGGDDARRILGAARIGRSP